MEKLNLPEYSFRIKEQSGKDYIFDPIRKKFVRLSPEEWVRQHVIAHFIQKLNYPLGLISVEQSLNFGGKSVRYDLVVYSPQMTPWMLVECKAPNVSIDQKTIEQATKYNIVEKGSWILLTNGLNHFLYHIDYKTRKTKITNDFPAFNT